MIDSHCHLCQTDYEIPVVHLIEKAHEEGVEKMLDIACDTNDWPELLELIKHNPRIYGAIGIHPEYALKEEGAFLEKIPHIFTKNPKLVAIGEIGLDYSEQDIPFEKQQALFYQQIRIAHNIQKPIIVHSREAEKDTLSILMQAEQEGILKNQGVIHCFTGSLEFAKQVLKLGFYISISGIVTFKSAHTLREIITEIPLDRLLIETDCPWLAPEPFRGKTNQPAYVKQTLLKVAELRKISSMELDKVTTDNFNQLFLKGKK